MSNRDFDPMRNGKYKNIPIVGSQPDPNTIPEITIDPNSELVTVCGQMIRNHLQEMYNLPNHGDLSPACFKLGVHPLIFIPILGYAATIYTCAKLGSSKYYLETQLHAPEYSQGLLQENHFKQHDATFAEFFNHRFVTEEIRACVKQAVEATVDMINFIGLNFMQATIASDQELTNEQKLEIIQQMQEKVGEQIIPEHLKVLDTPTQDDEVNDSPDI